MQSNLDKYKAEGNEKRVAFEWFVKDADEFYWRMTKERIAAEADKLHGYIKRITALAVTSTVISIVAIAIFLYVLLHK